MGASAVLVVKETFHSSLAVATIQLGRDGQAIESLRG